MKELTPPLLCDEQPYFGSLNPRRDRVLPRNFTDVDLKDQFRAVSFDAKGFSPSRHRMKRLFASLSKVEKKAS
jgi:hypothetical protein